MKRIPYILTLVATVVVGAMAQHVPNRGPDSKPWNTITPTLGETVDTLTYIAQDGTVVTTTQPVEPVERVRRARIKRLRDYVRNASPTAAESVTAIKDIIRELGQED